MVNKDANMTSATRARILALIICQGFVVTSALSEEINMRVDDARPVSKAVDALSARLGYVITYEDPRYEYADDLMDATAAVRPNGPPTPKIIRPKGGKLELKGLAMPKAKDTNAVGNMLDDVLALQSQSNAGGRFRVLKVGATFHIVPSGARNKTGQWVQQASVLDAPITIANAQRTVRAMIEEICNEVSRVNNVKVAHMDAIVGAFLSETADFGAYNEPARDVLTRTLAATGSQMGWKLNYIPNEGWTGYFLMLTQLPSSEVTRKQPAPRASEGPNPMGPGMTPMGPRR